MGVGMEEEEAMVVEGMEDLMVEVVAMARALSILNRWSRS